MKKISYKKLWFTWLRTHPICSCGCGKPIIITYYGFRASLLNSGGPPKYVYPHSYLGKKKYWNYYTNWLDTKPLCACGCKTPLRIKYDTFVKVFRKTEKPPLFYREHRPKKQEEKIEQIKKKPMEPPMEPPKPTRELPSENQKMCKLIKTMEGRCAPYSKCLLASKCLTIVAERKWSGWKSEKYG